MNVMWMTHASPTCSDIKRHPELGSQRRSIMPVGEESQNLPKVLWIDDEVQSGDSDLRSLEMQGLAVECVDSGQDALRLAQERAFDAILLDLRLRDASGLEILERFIAAGEPAPIVILTGFAAVDTAVAAMKLGAADYRMKPLDAEEIVALLRTLIARRDRNPRRDESQHGELEWLGRQCDRFADCMTKRELVADTLRLLLERHLGLAAFFGCAEALRLVLTSAESSLTLLASEMRHAILGSARKRGPKHPKLREAIEALERDGRKVSQNMFAGRIGLSRAYLCRLLTAQTERTPSEWCRGAVMRAALPQVLQSTEQISQIAYEAGYQHPSQFDLHFETTFGSSPTELRQVFRSLSTLL